eukprot:TRINITY_DN9712_c0_g1_i6.p1 TRINITY_DN9712_c0_g1~~TRINITY_DN9712_c0_g1_i6.p1  ORF type:complete len:130 (+),score=18.20 TRINITY_DN9712_c0_g1_i6:67-456(+)
MAAYYLQQTTPMYVNATPPVQAISIASVPSYQPMYMPNPMAPAPMFQPAMQPMMQPPQIPCPPPVNGSVMVTQENMDETKTAKYKICPYCGCKWNPITVSKITTANTAIGVILGPVSYTHLTLPTIYSV